jgi:hypothetical protein
MTFAAGHRRSFLIHVACSNPGLLTVGELRSAPPISRRRSPVSRETASRGEKGMSRSDNSDRLKVTRIELISEKAARLGGCVNATVPAPSLRLVFPETSNERSKGRMAAEM